MFKTFIVFILVILYTEAQVLRNEGDAARALKAPSEVDLEKLRSLLTEEAKQDLTSRAEDALNTGLLGADQQDEYNVSSTCMDDTETLFMALSAGEDWAVRSKFLYIFLVDEGIEDPNTAMNGPSSARQRHFNGVSLASR